MTVKVGDKVRVTTDEYPESCPRGTVCTAVDLLGEGEISAIVENGDGFEWVLEPNQYEMIVTEHDYAEQAAKHGIKITIEFGDGKAVTFDGKK